MWLTYALLSALFAALTAVLAKIGLENINSTLAYAIRTVFVLGFAWGIVFLQKLQVGVNHITSKSWTFLFLSAMATALSWLFYFKALQMGTVSKVAPVDKLSLVMAIILAALFLGEKISWQVFFGALLMTIGTVIIAVSR